MSKETPDSLITTFRLLPEDVENLKSKLPKGSSRHKLARKVVADFANGKLVYTDKTAAAAPAGKLRTAS